MKRALSVVVVLLVAGIAGCVGLFLWQLHPWVPTGTAWQVGKWRFADYDFQVWQRKNQSVFEPFADGLFVRRGTNEWHVYCFDIQDNYSPKIQLRETGGKVQVFRSGENRGEFDLLTGAFRRSPQMPNTEPEKLGYASVPPGQWWLRQSWPNNDPIEEQGGYNLSSFINNSPTIFIDLFGLYDPKPYNPPDPPTKRHPFLPDCMQHFPAFRLNSREYYLKPSDISINRIGINADFPNFIHNCYLNIDFSCGRRSRDQAPVQSRIQLNIHF